MDNLVIEHQPQPGLTVLALNRPDKRNALNIPMLEALCAAVGRVAETPGQRALIIRGEGPVFCAGLDLAEARDTATSTRSGALVRELLERVYACPCVTLAAVHGAALAGGAGLMTACDIAIATMDAKLGFPEVQRGLVAGLVMTFLRRQVSERHARELLLLGEIVEAERAAEIGLINRAVPTDLLDVAVDRCIDKVLKAPPGAIQETKTLFDALWHHPIAGDFEMAHEVHARMRESDEAKEGMAAFVEKRKPHWER